MVVYVILLEYPYPGKVGSDLGEENPITSSELGEYPTYIIRLIFVWGMHHQSTVLEILSELSEDPT